MWEKLFNLFRLLFTFAETWQKFEAKVEATLKEHSEQIRELSDNQSRLYYEFQLEKERNAHEREKEILRLENRMLHERLERLERMSLPASPADQKPPDDKSEKE